MIRFWFLLFLMVFAGSAYGEEVCFQCHSRAKMFNGKVHKPVASGKCYTCHIPHVSRNKWLLKKSPRDICFECHKSLKSRLARAVFVHSPVEKKACFKCHVAHASNNGFLLRHREGKLCVSCHGEVRKKYKYVHQPFKNGECTACHDPHVGNNMVFVKGADKLCFKCHRNRKRMAKVHRYGNLKNMKCVECHNPHGSERRFLVRAVSHTPFARGECVSCHGVGKSLGSGLCLKCHPKVVASFKHLHNHQLGRVEGNSCLSCHNPHVGDNNKLLKDVPARMCQSCHSETYKQKKESLYVHPDWKNCFNCHAGHGSDHPAMLKGDGNAVCVRCHETQGKFTHPVGDEVMDPRNGQPITCVTCHDTMGTNFKYNLRMSGEAALCIECHKNY